MSIEVLNCDSRSVTGNWQRREATILTPSQKWENQWWRKISLRQSTCSYRRVGEPAKSRHKNWSIDGDTGTLHKYNQTNFHQPNIPAQNSHNIITAADNNWLKIKLLEQKHKYQTWTIENKDQCLDQYPSYFQ